MSINLAPPLEHIFSGDAMRTGRPRSSLTLSDIERKQLEEWAAARTLPHSLVQRAKVILLSADDVPTTDIGRRVGLSIPMVVRWRHRFREARLAGLYDAPRPGRPRTH